MKKIFLLTILCSISTICLYAQTKDVKFQIYAGTDYPSLSGFVISHIASSSIPFHIGAKYYINEKLSAGVIYDRSSSQQQDVVLNTYTYNRKYTFNTFLVTFDYSWKRTEKYNLYSGIGIGNQDESYTTSVTKGTGNPPAEKLVNNGFTIDLVFIGIHHRIGASKFGYYGQIGFLATGIVNAGVSYNVF